MHGHDPGILVGQHEQVAVFRLPRVVARIFDGSGVSVSHERQRCQQIGLADQGQLLLSLRHLKSQRCVARTLLDLLLRLSFRVPSHHEQRGAGKPRRKENEREEEFRTEL